MRVGRVKEAMRVGELRAEEAVVGRTDGRMKRGAGGESLQGTLELLAPPMTLHRRSFLLVLQRMSHVEREGDHAK